MHVAIQGWCEGVKVGVSALFSSRKREGMDVGILRIGACSTSLKVASQDKEVVQ
jgi:hypothetical protein